MEPAFFVSEFSLSILSILIKQCFGSDFNDIESKLQVKNIVEQLEKLGARTIVCEREYIDKDYSDDYANYYVQSFKDYRGSCARLHFFSKRINQKEFTSILDSEQDLDAKEQELNSLYLGFIVIRPLPFNFLGKVCIKNPYEGRITRRYQVSLFGIALAIQSIAFQEQDRVVSACATTAVWSLLHALPEIHNKHIPSPSAITLAAIGSPLQNVNSFPSKGLNLAQITAALESLSLRQHSFSISRFDKNEKNFLRKFISCYVNSRIPVFIGAQIYKKVADHEYVFHGDHAVVAIGIQINKGNYSLIVHDDRLGPFIKMDLISASIVPGKAAATAKSGVTGANTDFAFEIPGTDELLVPNAALVATYPKKKIGLEPIIRTARMLLESFKEDYLINKNLPAIFSEVGESLSPTALLHECHELKADYFKSSKNSWVRKVLVAHLPHFIWQIRYLIDEKPIVDFLFDATDTPNGNAYIQYVVLDEDIGNYFINGLEQIATGIREKNEFDPVYRTINDQTIYSYHIDIFRRLAPNAPTHKEFLTKTYGELRSPYYLKDTKFAFYPAQILPGDSANRYRFYSAREVGDFDLRNFILSNQTIGEKPSSIWVIDEEGALIIGPDTGHPNLTGANPARIAGEIKLSDCCTFFSVNAQSGRYSKQYQIDSANEYLQNARLRWKEIFPDYKFA